MMTELVVNGKITNTLAIELISSYLSVPARPTRGCILSTVHQHLGILGDPVVLDTLEGPTSFDIKGLIKGDPITIYFVIPPNKLAAYSMLLRLWFTSLLYLFTERTRRPRNPTLFIIDECANLGKLDGLMTAITLMRSYGLRIWCMFQSIGQIKDKYRNDWMTIIDNCDVIQAYGFKHYPTAKEMSEIIGSITPGQLLKIPRENAVLMRAGQPVEIIKRLDYLKDNFFKNKGFKKNPIYEYSKLK
jgi:type IV secretion system protein VirD4